MSDQYNLPADNNQRFTKEQEEQIREIIAASLANWTGITRFRTIESTTTTITDFTNSQHNHSNAVNGGQINPNTAFTAVVGVANGGTGVNTIANNAIVIGQGSGAISTITGLAGTKVYYVSDSSGGAVNRKLTFTNGVLTAET